MNAGRLSTAAIAVSWPRWLASALIIGLILGLPSEPWALDILALWHIPVELGLVLLLPFVLPRSAWRVALPLLVLVLTMCFVMKAANLAMTEFFGRSIAPFNDLPLIPIGLGTLAMNSVVLAVAAVAGVCVVIGGIALAVRWSLVQIANGTEKRFLPSAALGVEFVALSLTGSPDASLATAGTSVFLRDQVAEFREDWNDTAAFKTVMAHTPDPAKASLAALKGTDVLVIFIESYGRCAVTDDPYASVVTPTLKRAQSDLASAGFQARSAWLISPTFGGGSWFAHSTVMSGLWVNSQARYSTLIDSTRPTLVSDFKRAGWRTVGVMPEISGVWPAATYFGFDQAYTASDLGYRGAPFGYITMPDQYVLKAFADRELGRPDRPPVMAEIALISSHAPWVPVPKMVPWDKVGDGKIFASARTQESVDDVWEDPARVKQFYARTIDYVLQAVASFITTYGNDHTLVIVMGDHQPMGFISGDPSNHAVPVHVIARNSALLHMFDDGQWTEGMLPNSASPVARMDSLREHILTAFAGPSSSPAH